MNCLSLNKTPKGLCPVISFIGCCNVGKSSLLNALTKEEVSIVSEIKGTTTDVVQKRHELIPVGPVIFYDTAGLDDTSDLGEKRIHATMKVLEKSDLVVLICAEKGITKTDSLMIKKLRLNRKKFVIIFNKDDCVVPQKKDLSFCEEHQIPFIKTNVKKDISFLYHFLAGQIDSEDMDLFGKFLKKEDIVILVTPIDKSAPKGRLILPQVQTIREILNKHAITMIVQPEEFASTLSCLTRKPRLIISDSQVVKQVSQLMSCDISLTTFSVLMAKLKGDISVFKKSLSVLNHLNDGDKILICESCSHKICSDDIAHVKIPNAIRTYSKHNIIFDYTHGDDFPESLSGYKLVVHCGACMFNKTQMMARIQQCLRENVPITNFGLLMAKLNNIYLADIS
jgi:[FeFe] hydrogenase H-cluster maturation GTPase HydF